jgi:hypothetical protein
MADYSRNNSGNDLRIDDTSDNNYLTHFLFVCNRHHLPLISIGMKYDHSSRHDIIRAVLQRVFI